MKTVSRAVQDVLHRSPFLLDTLSEGVGNTSEIARKIKKEVEEILYEEVSLASIGMALRRFEKSLKKRPPYGARFLKELGNISVQSHLVEFSFANGPHFLKLQQAVLKTLENDDTAFLNVSRGVRETIVVVSKEHEKRVEDILKDEKGLRKQSPLASLTLKLPEASLAVPGVYYPILKALAMEGINFVEIVSANTELTILFEERVIDEAFSVIKRLTS